VDRVVRLLLLLLGTLTAGRPYRREDARYRADDAGGRGEPGFGYMGPDGPAGGRGEPGIGYVGRDAPADEGAWPGRPGPPPWHWRAAGGADPEGGPNDGSGRRRRRIPRQVKWAAVAVAVGLIFRRAIASVVLTALSAALHLVGVDAHLPSIRFAWPWQTIAAGTTTNTDLGPWVLQKIEGISRPALGRANFNFLFTHKVSKNIGPWPCWYAGTFYALARASATVDLNPGPAWWAPARGHYRLQVLSRPLAGKPGHVTVTMVLPRPQLPQSVHDVTIDNIPSKPVDTQHSWTYPGLGCGVVLRPQFPESVLYSQAQRIAFYKVQHMPQVTRPLIKTAEAEAVQTIRDNFIQPTVNSLGYTLDRLTIRWAATP
jgi:hypothetical protein